MSSSIVTPDDFDKASYGEVRVCTGVSHSPAYAYGQVIQLFTPSGPSITFVEKGLHITSIKFKDVKGAEHDIIIGSDNPTHYVDERAVR